MKTEHKTVWAVRRPNGTVIESDFRITHSVPWTRESAEEFVKRQGSSDWRVVRRTEITRSTDWQEATW